MARVCVIGAGAAGLCAGRHLLADPSVGLVDILEQTSQLGGTWVYTESTGCNDFGLPIHTSMYKNLRTNLPKEIMGFPDFPVPESEQSYLPANEILAFLQSYADKYDVTSHIKFNHYVQLVISKAGGPRGELWDVTFKSLVTGEPETREYDFVFVCNGHYNTPSIPSIPGLEEFQGEVIHSHDYRLPEIFADKRVLVVGAGPSGMDIALEITAVTSKVILSHHHKKQFPQTMFPEQKPDVIKIKEKTAFFEDGTEEEVDVILLCTGYQYNFPFLHQSSGIVVDDNCVEPLYKHLVNIHHPTMCFIGIPNYVCAFPMFDLQVRYFVRWISGAFSLPTQAQMQAHWEQEKAERAMRGYTRRQAHFIGPDQEKYFASLSAEAGTKTLPSVLTKIMLKSLCFQNLTNQCTNYRQNIYKIINDDTYEILSNGKQ
nr:flavin-dependent monooxygenase 3C [Chilo suppressalis]